MGAFGIGQDQAQLIAAGFLAATIAGSRVGATTGYTARFTDVTALPTAQLLMRLNADPEAPWRTHGPNGLTAHKLGAMLREYRITSANIRFPDGTQAKGYHRDAFADAWSRYCPETGTTADRTDDKPSRLSVVTPLPMEYAGGAA